MGRLSYEASLQDFTSFRYRWAGGKSWWNRSVWTTCVGWWERSRRTHLDFRVGRHECASFVTEDPGNCGQPRHLKTIRQDPGHSTWTGRGTPTLIG